MIIAVLLEVSQRCLSVQFKVLLCSNYWKLPIVIAKVVPLFRQKLLKLKVQLKIEMLKPKAHWTNGIVDHLDAIKFFNSSTLSNDQFRDLHIFLRWFRGVAKDNKFHFSMKTWKLRIFPPFTQSLHFDDISDKIFPFLFV